MRRKKRGGGRLRATVGGGEGGPVPVDLAATVVVVAHAEAARENSGGRVTAPVLAILNAGERPVILARWRPGKWGGGDKHYDGRQRSTQRSEKERRDGHHLGHPRRRENDATSSSKRSLFKQHLP
ncbi:hypothetical protein Nepgr_013213 [Nepenthes gracilis]|uniref:Uncharacterized protein n=1 Tax=Nepenthes gracilis TaxID=150966 RepID=A0AAD3SIS0_NEPGR|nr:hypothetical protein Nepgr_013213 [Nepenthes gracilis]